MQVSLVGILPETHHFKYLQTKELQNMFVSVLSLCVSSRLVHCRFPRIPSSHEASIALRGGPYGLAVHQCGIWDLALQHLFCSQTGSVSTLQ